MNTTTLVWGSGAVGGLVGAALVRAGKPVVFVEVAEAHRTAMQTGGLRVFGPVHEYRVETAVRHPDEVAGRFGRILLCVKCRHTAEAVARLKDHLADDGIVVSLQNGLNAEDIAAAVGPERVAAGLVAFYADVTDPGVIHYGGRGTVAIGYPSGRSDARLTGAVDLLRHFDDRVFATGNIGGFLWGKLTMLTLLFASAVTMDSMVAVLENPGNRPLLARLGSEVMTVAAAEGVTAEAFDGFDAGVFLPGVDGPVVDAMFESMLVNCRRSAKTHSGIWRDLAVHKRPTEVDCLLGRIAAKGAARGVSCPMLTRLISMIHDIEAGRAAQSTDLLAALVREEEFLT